MKSVADPGFLRREAKRGENRVEINEIALKGAYVSGAPPDHAMENRPHKVHIEWEIRAIRVSGGGGGGGG